ncbi:MAG: carbon-nitrogen hydrolase family protein [Alphaproteobacteria bacterium]|uniref:carbon-nitrogen hydrolase family protein n=1 Tax=Aestuariivirga sp. TaxID=2650926 RepID=UPI00301800B7|nr:carbon-nitrogen hydrolase family protein [Alphaproteobacteria bacterium]
MSFIAACVQSTATPDVHADIRVLTGFIRAAAATGAGFIATPEYCAGLDTKGGKMFPVAFTEAEHPVLPAMQGLAKELHVWLLIGSIGVRAPDGKIFNRCFMLSPSGAITARYDKIHLFDINLGAGGSYHESATIEAGKAAVISPCAEGLIGLSICYDIRFPHLYRAYAQEGAEMLAAPAAFTRVTGDAHWHVLQRARAIENGAYVISPGQCGTLAGGAECYGHSLIVDPWGRVLADGGTEPGIVTAEIDLNTVAETRRRIPSLRHDKPYSATCLATPKAS